jgi:hypothetical protein
VPRARVPTRTSHGRTFEPAASPFEVKVGGAAIVPVRFLTSEPMDIVVSVDDIQPHRRQAAVVERVTVRRRFSVDAGESVALLVLGDDLAPGRHMLSFVGAPGKELWVHAPWASERRGQKGAAPRWISGDFEE